MRYLTSGESHGQCLNLILDGLPSGVKINLPSIEGELRRRSHVYGRSSRQSREKNCVKVLSGIRDGKSCGNPICAQISNIISADNNTSSDSAYLEIEEQDFIPRPGHADLNGVLKHNFDDCLNVSERASARETAARIIVGSIAKDFLVNFGVEVFSFVYAIGSVIYDCDTLLVNNNLPDQCDIGLNPVMCPDSNKGLKMIEQIDRARDCGDTLGGMFCTVATGVVPGLGGYAQAYDRLDSKIMASIGSIPSVKMVEIGCAMKTCQSVGSTVMDGLSNDRSSLYYRATNFSGGIEGGLTNGMPVIVRGAVKPLSSMHRPIDTIDLRNLEHIRNINTKRTDTCVVPAASVVAESELAFTIANAYINKFGCDSLNDIMDSYKSYKRKLDLFK